MTDDPDILRAARYLLGLNGNEAIQRAEQRAADLFLSGDQGAAEIWQQIAKAIAQLSRAKDVP